MTAHLPQPKLQTRTLMLGADPLGAPRLRRRAQAWVNQCTAVSAVLVLVLTCVPGSASVALCCLEALLCWKLGRIYRGVDWTLAQALVAAKAISVAAFVGPLLAMEASILLGPAAFIAKPIVAAIIVNAMGKWTMRYFEAQETANVS